MRSREASRSSPAGTGEAIISDAPREKSCSTHSITRDSSPQAATESSMESLQVPCDTSGNPAAINVFLVEGSPGKSGELVPDRRSCLIRVVVDAYR